MGLPSPNTHDAGYSLIEIMVALFIVGLTTSFVVLSMPRGADPVKKTSDRLKQQLELVRNVSKTSGNTFGLLIEEQTSSILVYQRGEWIKSNLFGDFDVVDIEASLVLEVVPKTKRFSIDLKSDGDENAPLKPQIWFDPTGIATSSPIELSSDEQTIRFVIARNGELDVSVR